MIYLFFINYINLHVFYRFRTAVADLKLQAVHRGSNTRSILIIGLIILKTKLFFNKTVPRTRIFEQPILGNRENWLAAHLHIHTYVHM